MKIIHFADLHLGVETYGKSINEHGLNSRVADFLDSFDKLVDYSIAEQADLVLFCGDVYKKSNPSMTQQREFAIRIKKLTDAGIPVYLLMGNHDLPNLNSSASSADIFNTLQIDGVRVISKPELTIINTKHGKIQIVGMPWIRRSLIMQRSSLKNKTIDELNTEIAKLVTSMTAELASKVDRSIPCVFAGHLWCDGSKAGSEESRITLGSDPVILVSNIALDAFDYVALGHIHRQQILRKEKPAVVYSGSLDSLDFGDADQEKGFMVVDIDKETGTCEYEFVPTNGRKFIKLYYAVSVNDLNPTAAIIQLISRTKNLEGNIIKLTISTSEEMEKLISDEEIRQAASSAYHFEMIKNIEKEARARAGVDFSSDKLPPEELLKLYLDTNSGNYSESNREELLSYGKNIILEQMEQEKNKD